MNHRNVKRTVNPGVCETCVHVRKEYNAWAFKTKYYCLERPICKRRCEKYENKNAIN